jgi:branched-chain amino acid aminotransferase
MYYDDKTIIYYDGKFTKACEERVSLYTQSLHYGIGVFEGIRAYDTPNGIKILKGKEHFERLLYSAKVTHIKHNYTVDDLLDLSKKILEKNNMRNGYIRPLFFFGEAMGLKLSKDIHFLLCAWPWDKLLGHELLNVCLSSYRKPNPESCYLDAKISGQYINSILATMEADHKGYDESILLDVNGYVAEGPGENIFIEKDHKLYTPPLGSILPGITRKIVIDLARENGIPVEEKFFLPDELKYADSAFFTGTAIEVTGIKGIDRFEYPLEWKKSLGYYLSQRFYEYINR